MSKVKSRPWSTRWNDGARSAQVCTRMATGLAAMQHSSLRSYSAAAALDPCSAHAAVTILSSAQVAVTDILRLLAVLLAVSQEVSAAVAGR